MNRAAITIDVDSLHFYRQIHGLRPALQSHDPIYTRAVPRFLELIDQLRVPATLFLIGRDALAHAEHFAAARTMDVEVANHSFEHDYGLSRHSPATIGEDLRRAHAVLEDLAPDRKVVGFRAPGYNTSAALLRAVAELGYRYDSSRLPSPWYFAGRAAAIGFYRLLGRSSRSLVGKGSHFAGSLTPYCHGSLIELPISCDPLTRIPLIGNVLAAIPAWASQRMMRSALRSSSYLNIELHAIDLLDSTDVPADVASVQRDLSIPLKSKLKTFHALFSLLKEECQVLTLRDMADAFRGAASGSEAARVA